MVCGNITKKAITNNIARAINAVIQVLIFSILRLRRRVFLSIFLLQSTATYYNQMYNISEFNLFFKEGQ